MVTLSSISRPSLVAGLFNDLYRFSPTSNAWTALSVASPPSARYDMGFVATPDGMLYVFGGWDNSGHGEGSVWWEEPVQQELTSI
jgi:N-acetylneuraminic acid mutarotase